MIIISIPDFIERIEINRTGQAIQVAVYRCLAGCNWRARELRKNIEGHEG